MFLTNGVPDRRYDCYVIGAGPAGITLALELAKANRTVLVFETGTVTEPRDDMPNAVNYGHFPDGWWDRHSIRVLGGTSRVWSGLCATPMEVDFANPAAGVRWPITKSDLAPYYRRAAPVLDREPAILDVETPLVPGFAYRPYSESTRPTRFGRKYQEELSTSSLVDVAVGTSVIGLDANASRSAVRALTCFRHASGATEQLDLDPAQNVVVAGGGISNAQLFLQPRADGAVPVGNESGLAGKYLMEHLHLGPGYAGEVVLDDDLDQQSLPTDFGTAAHAVVPDDEQMRRHGLLGCVVCTCYGHTTDHAMAEYLAGEYGKSFHHYLCSVVSEMAPSVTNEVFLTGERAAAGLYRPAARCVIGAGDFRNVEMTLRLLGESLIASGKGRVRINNERLYRQPGGGGGHIMGTTRMGTSRWNSVVDRDCRVHGYDNLFVAGSSVFPTGGYANPTLTIVALALRLADTLATAG